MSSKFLSSILAATLTTLAPVALAQDGGESQCEIPGLTLATDAEGDASIVVVPDPTGIYDLRSLQVAQPPQDDGVPRLVFTLKVGSLTALPPQSAWFASFMVGTTVYGVRMLTDSLGAESFISYTAAASTGTDGSTNGSLVDASRPAEPASNYSADGTITIVVKASDLGLRGPGSSLKGFNGGTVLTAGAEGVGSAAFPTDGMPDDFSRSGEFILTDNVPCTSGAKSVAAKFGGAFGYALLLPLFVFAGLRRRV